MSAIKQSGVWKPFVQPSIRVAGVWKPAVGLFRKTGGVWQSVWGSGTFSARSGTYNYNDSSTGAGLPQVVFESDGTLDQIQNGDVLNWGLPTTAGGGAAYWIKFLSSSGTGTYNGPTLGTWVQLNTNRSVSISPAPGGAARFRILSYQISTSSSGTPVIASGTVSLTSDNS